MQTVVDEYLHADLEGQTFCEVHDADFILQQCTVEELKVAISVEISGLS